MATDPTTPNYGFTLATFGLDRDTWGGLTNNNWSALDTYLNIVETDLATVNNNLQSALGEIIAYLEPVGTVKVWPTPTAPPGWVPCDGWGISRTDFPELFALIGTYWGAGDGVTTFNVPNLQGFVLAHRGGIVPAVGSAVGEVYHTLAWGEMPVHSHTGSTDQQGSHLHNYTGTNETSTNVLGAGGNAPQLYQAAKQTDAQGLHTHNVTVGNAGGGASHNNMQPTVGMLWIIKCSPTHF